MSGEVEPGLLSVIVPVFNEAGTLPHVLAAVSRALPGVRKEIILVDDGSSDGTREWIEANVPSRHRSGSGIRVGADGSLAFSDDLAVARTTIRSFFHESNQGKGAGLKTGLAAAHGEVIVIQDADLEYDPIEWAAMYDLITHRKVADVVYGSRFRGRISRFPYLRQYIANIALSKIFTVLYGQTLTDIEVCYKMFTKEVGKHLRITCNDFGCEIQIVAQVARSRRWRIQEVGISYQGRTYGEGKRIGWRDGLKALWYLVCFRVVPLTRRP